jgi:hypothetical protein
MRNISIGAQYVTLQKHLPHPSFSSLLFSNPAHKTKTQITNSWEINDSNPPCPIKYLANQQQVLRFAVLSSNLSIMCKIAGPKPIY